ncbi:raftlin [Gouania willdenowi]|uniref:Raftlin-like n=1 Tax=Gouania willdenowi TaxID=441366 RepID=A0A8C5DZS0_GOUWI|nr:raftlin-like [Gouania willdenowi]
MGCRLPKLRKTEEKCSPGNIYSTLRRPQVETKVGVAYTYHFLDFILGKEELPVSSVLCLSSVRELPVQVKELYMQGFVLVAVHPFVHTCGPRHAHIQRQLHRAVLIRETPSLEKSQLRWARNRLETDVCVAGEQAADPEVIQSYVKRVQDVAEQGVMFVGFLQQPGGSPCFFGQCDPEDLSSLHSSPSPIHRTAFSINTSPMDPTEPLEKITDSDDDLKQHDDDDHSSVSREPDFHPLKHTGSLDHNLQVITSQIGIRECTNHLQYHTEPSVDTIQTDDQREQGLEHEDCSPSEDAQSFTEQRGRRGSRSDSWLSSPQLDSHHQRKSKFAGTAAAHNNNHIIRLKGSEKDKGNTSPPQSRMQLFALYNHTEELNTSMRFYSLRVPLQVQKDSGLITQVDAHWLDHMTQHFTSGARLIDGFFHFGDDNDNGVSSVDSVFIFQSSADESTNASYDAIVVEQWTVVDGVVVKADYIPLLQSLAPYGWRLMCVLPTPVVKTNSDGSLSTKQILFLQRPVLQRKRKDFKRLNLRGRSKTKKSSAGETLEESENRLPLMETEMDRLGGNTTEDEEAEVRDSSGWSLQRDAEHVPHHQRSFSLWVEGRGAGEEEEEETNIDIIPLSKQEKSVRWTDFCKMSDGGVKNEVRMEERIKQQLFSGVC